MYFRQFIFSSNYLWLFLISSLIFCNSYQYYSIIIFFVCFYATWHGLFCRVATYHLQTSVHSSPIIPGHFGSWSPFSPFSAAVTIGFYSSLLVFSISQHITGEACIPMTIQEWSVEPSCTPHTKDGSLLCSIVKYFCLLDYAMVLYQLLKLFSVIHRNSCILTAMQIHISNTPHVVKNNFRWIWGIMKFSPDVETSDPKCTCYTELHFIESYVFIAPSILVLLSILLPPCLY